MIILGLGVSALLSYFLLQNSVSRIEFELGFDVPASASKIICAGNGWQRWKAKNRYSFAMFDIPRDSVLPFLALFNVIHDNSCDFDGKNYVVDEREAEGYQWELGESYTISGSLRISPLAGSEESTVLIYQYQGRTIVDIRAKWGWD